MGILTADNLSKSYGIKTLFKDISFGIEEGEKIGIIGVNGTGKSTLLRLLAGNDVPDQGSIIITNNLRIEYLPQDPEFDNEATVLQQVFKGDSPLMQLLRDYEKAVDRLNRDPDNTDYQKTLMLLGQKMEDSQAWQLESEAKTILTKLGITEFDKLLGTLSGGQRKRVAMAGALISPSDLLILDEPTNHIDNATVDWLEAYLNGRKGALVMITHDRYFLDRVANRILELDRGQLYPYPGNYTRYLELRAERDEQEDASELKRQNRLRNELAWIRRGAKARSTKQKARIDRFEKLQSDKPTEKSGKIEINAGSTRLGKKVIDCSHVDKSYSGQETMIEDFSLLLARDDRIGIIGPNGLGKSTLLNLLAGRIEPDSGIIEWGPTVKMGYFGQENSELDLNLKVIETIKAVAEVISTPDGKTITAAQMLERFLFTPPQQWTTVGKLSGGEKRRLYLLQILMQAPNVLFLDEPTNDLDIHTLSILEEYLEDFPGAVIAVSHDRYFLDRVADRIFSFEGNGVIRSYIGNYSDYREQMELREKNEQSGTTVASPKRMDTKVADPSPKDKDRPLKMSFKEAREYEQIEDRIAETEDELRKIMQQMNEASSNYGKLNELTKVQQALEIKLEDYLERWSYLSELAESLAQSKK